MEGPEKCIDDSDLILILKEIITQGHTDCGDMWLRTVTEQFAAETG